ncbi:hypothetical protein QJQ45_022845 [Haematococcus lacustris]|nr:hypothetical protein QJQ45_022845 [Haematococcus lacustris]
MENDIAKLNMSSTQCSTIDQRGPNLLATPFAEKQFLEARLDAVQASMERLRILAELAWETQVVGRCQEHQRHSMWSERTPIDATLEKEAMRPTPVLTANNERVVLNEKRTGLLEIQKSKTIVMARPGSESDKEGWHKGSLVPAVAGCKESSDKDKPELVTDAELQAVLDEYSDVFQDMPPGLPPDRGVGHTIRMETDALPPYKRPYKLSPKEEAEVKRQVSELQARGLIEPSSSPYGAPVLFVEKKDGSLRMSSGKVRVQQDAAGVLGYIVGSKGIAVDPAKLSGCAVDESDQQQVTAAYDWDHFGGAELKAYKGLKEALCSAPVLALPDFSKPFVVCTDASLVGTGGVLMQDGRPIAYTSRKMSPETRYATGEQELLGIIRAVREWRCYLDGAVDVTIRTDHNPLIYLQTQPNLSRRQEELSRYKYEIKYILGATNVADPISRNPALANEVALTSSSSPHNADSEDAMTVIMTLSSRAEGLIYAITTCRTAARLRESAELGQVAAREAAQRAGQLAPPDDLAAAHTPGQARMTSAHKKGAQPGGGESLRQQQQTTESQNKSNKQGDDGQSTTESGPLTLMQAIKQAYAADTRFADEAFTSQLYQHEGLWLTEWGRVVVPDGAALRKKVIYTMHDTRSTGHLGMTKTLEQVTRWFTWPGVSENVKSYVRSCHSCQVNKSSAKKLAGLLQPLPIPERPRDSVSMDLIVKLPASGPNKYDSILVFVDRLTKMVHLVKTWESMTAAQYAKLLLEHVFRLHGMPRSVVSDRGPQLHNKFGAEVTKLLQVQVNLSSAYHPETDGQTERVNRVIEEMLRHFIRPDQRDWAEYLPLVEFAINNAWQELVRSTPFYLNYGYHPRLAELLDLPQKVPQAHEFVKGMKTAVEQARQACLARAQKRMKRYNRVSEYWKAQTPTSSTWLEPNKGKRKGKCKKRRLEFLVKWQGHGDEHNTWELSTQLVGCQELLASYLTEHNLSAEAEEAADGEAEAKDDVEAEAQA